MVADASPTVRVADRADAVGLAATVKLTVPFPFPGLLMTATQLSELVPVQAHWGPVQTLTLPAPPLAETDTLAGATAYAQDPLKEKRFDGALNPVPADAIAATRAS